jgi:hypothetical protein
VNDEDGSLSTAIVPDEEAVAQWVVQGQQVQTPAQATAAGHHAPPCTEVWWGKLQQLLQFQCHLPVTPLWPAACLRA